MIGSPREITGTSTGKPPARSTPRLTCSASSRRWALQPATSLQLFRIPMIGRPRNASSGNPCIRNWDRCPIRSRGPPSHHDWLRRAVGPSCATPQPSVSRAPVRPATGFIHRMICHDDVAMKELYPLSGVVAIPQTPFDDHDRIDFGSLARGVADRLAAGVDGLLYPVVASEGSKLTPTERQAATRAVLEQAAPSVPVIVGASADDAPTARSLAEFAMDHGAAGVLVQPPVALLRDEPAPIAYFR